MDSQAGNLLNPPRMRARNVDLPILVPEGRGVIPLELIVRRLRPGERIEGIIRAEDDLYGYRKLFRSDSQCSGGGKYLE